MNNRARNPPVIRTPDQRVRVFISSTINELSDERRAARQAIEQLRLIPVFFEAGARPHPPRDLYAAYLEQSHIFLGIYWNSYGWIAPGADISGLEDEYRLSRRMPRLIYVKRSTDRDPRLNELLKDIERSDTACYQFFQDAHELAQLIENDVSILLSETFESALERQPDGEKELASVTPFRRKLDLPGPSGSLIGRDADLEKLSDLLLRSDVQVVTLLGAGGTGKTALSIHLSHLVQDKFADGAVFVQLAPVTDHRLLAATIADAFGIQDSGRQPIEATLAEFLADKNLLLVLDNFEQLAQAGRLVIDLLARAPEVRILVTSRTPLHVRGERIYHLAPLAIPLEGSEPLLSQLSSYSATQLFLVRARDVSPNLELTPENVAAIVQICQRLDGLPLAIELAAARTRYFQPAAIMSRIGLALDLVAKGHRDLPERQRTLRAAIDWSYNLLSDDMRRAFRQLGVFRRSWTLDAADIVLRSAGSELDIEEISEGLLDVCLIQPAPMNHVSETRFVMLQTVHEYAFEALMASPEAAETGLRYADYFRHLCLDAEPHLWGANSEPWLDKLEYEYQNIRAAFHIYTERSHLAEAWEMIAPMSRYWTIRGGLTEGAEWLTASRLEEVASGRKIPGVDVSRERAGVAMVWAALLRLQLLEFEAGFALLDRGEELLRDSSDTTGYALAMVAQACYGTFVGREGAHAKHAQSESLARAADDDLPLLYFLTWGGAGFLSQGRHDVMLANLAEAARLASERGYLHMLANVYMLEFQTGLMQDNLDLEDVAHKSEDLLRRFPEKGYKALKGMVLHNLAMSYLLRGRLAESKPFIKLALECRREAGEPEGLFFGTLTAVHHSALSGDRDLALKLLGAVDQFLDSTKYPLEIVTRREYDLARDAAARNGAPENEPAYREGRKLRIEDAVLLALHS